MIPKALGRVSMLARVLRVGMTAACLMYLIPCKADTLNWGAAGIAWTAGNLTQSFTVNGTTITITVSGNTGQIINQFGGPTPREANNLTPGTGSPSLHLAADYTNTTQSLTVTFTFSRQIANLAFTIYDVDYSASGSPFQDQIRNISASFGTSTYNATVTASTANQAANSGLANATITGIATNVDGSAGGDGNGGISFGSQGITSASFTWGSGPGAPTNPFQQWIAISNLDYTVVPEPSTWVGLVLLIVLVLGYEIRRRMGFRGASTVRS
ncbi:MAG: PEP-CTERM sorting domain-containing protein [Candidatus Methylacidiphilales bacterium]|nr:PEP-CTERM sorting domain-containing protein [Candidatus Methylacidiphilales bacterium]